MRNLFRRRVRDYVDPDGKPYRRGEGDSLVYTFSEEALQALTGRCGKWSPSHNHGPHTSCVSTCEEPPGHEGEHFSSCHDDDSFWWNEGDADTPLP